MGGAGREPGPSAMVVADLGGRSRGFGMGCQERQPQMNTYIGLWNWEHRGKVWFQAVLCQGAQIRPAGPGFSSAFSSSDSVGFIPHSGSQQTQASSSLSRNPSRTECLFSNI